MPLSSSFASREPGGQHPRQPSLTHLVLRLFDRICDPLESSKHSVEIEQQPRGLRIAVTRLAHGTGIEDPAAVELDLGSAGGEATGDGAVSVRDGERYVAMADEHDWSLRQFERCLRRLLGEDVLPDRVACARVKELDAISAA